MYRNRIKSIAIGSFDGVHRGHQALIAHAQAVVIIERNQSVITPGYRRVEYIQKPSFFYHLQKIKSLSADAFIQQLTHDFPALETIVVGYDFGFGHQKKGDTQKLQELFCGEVKIIPEVKYQRISIHSRSIKEYIQNGEIRFTNQLLNRHYTIVGKIIQGQGLGKEQLFATLNLKVDNYLLPKEGVYATKSYLQGTWYNSVSFIGHRVSTDGNFAVETHILDHNLPPIEGEIRLAFIDFIRDNKKFNSLLELKAQIQQDILDAKACLTTEDKVTLQNPLH